jgi:hypothetical protein
VSVTSAIDEVKAYLAINYLEKPRGSVAAYRHASPQAFQGGRKATARKVHALGFDGLDLLNLLFLQPPVDGGVLESYSPCRFMASHTFSYKGLVSL